MNILEYIIHITWTFSLILKNSYQLSSFVIKIMDLDSIILLIIVYCMITSISILLHTILEIEKSSQDENDEDEVIKMFIETYLFVMISHNIGQYTLHFLDIYIEESYISFSIGCNILIYISMIIKNNQI